MKKFYLIIFTLIFSLNVYSQEKWIPIYDANGQGLYVDVDGLDIYKGEEFFVWTLETHEPKLVIESVNGKISKTKTYYHINKDSHKYAINQIIYYDEKNNVLASFDYTKVPKAKGVVFNYPIMPGGQMELVLKTC